ncbi:eukaryotic translation initiation factor 3 subunit A-like isoform X3 [Papaver somniferum]|uniref:eukaryotic translation initiation factor 3 subunit A-like isoform X1 n=2 Tax=Papaver somniferum TaxID=3469 RepID=UPI000E7034EE|nr:eukaryotic translation initiation factor 3 subunit A-like isoform X1 [Papaver somniferum]XP_026457364.1 eukaryotic translation initiation factor 3 subunit A-like isoform X3 [Papaver somniferum]
MATFGKPENALKRAEELIHVGQMQAALQVLHDVITSKRYRAWQKTLERIMFKYVELCVEMRRGRFAKDGLIQYRIVCQQVNVGSLEEVIKHFLHLSTEKAENAKSQAEALEEALDVDDLEADKRPEDLMLSYVGGEKGKDRSDRELVTPWFKFLWETYRTVLEILRNNSKLEALYAMTAHRAFQFCKQYKRTTEFRRLCEIIRNHLANLNKYKDQRDRPDLLLPESLQLYQDTRFEQLKVATDLELWQEAFRSVEDIHGLMCMVKKTPKPSLMVVYYGKLTEIFRVSDSQLYNAYAWSKLFSLQKSYNRHLTQKDLQLIASSVVLAALSVTPYDRGYGASHLELDNEKERNLRMANLIGFSLDPKRDSREVLSRSALLSKLVSKGVLACASPEVKELYNLLEHEFLPLDLASRVQPLLGSISNVGGKISSASSVPEVQLSYYVPALKKLATLRLLQQVSQVYQTMKIEVLSKMIPFFDFSVVEKISVDAIKSNFIAMKVDHQKGAVLFGSLDLESDTLQGHLTLLAESLNKVRGLIYPPVKKTSKLGDALLGLAEVVNKEHKKLLARKSIIEKRKELQERQLLEMELEEEVKRKKIQQDTVEAEKIRRAEESRVREKQRIKKELDEKDRKFVIEEVFKKKGKRNLEGANLEGATKEQLIEMARKEQLKERQELEKRLQKLAKTMDHMERARREEEAPLIDAAFQQRLVEGKIAHERDQQQEIELSRERHVGDLQEKNRLSRMLENKNILQTRIVSRRQSEFDRLQRERDERIAQLLQDHREIREKRRKLIFYLRSEEERQKKLAEEEALRKQQEDEREKKEDLERKAKLDEIAEKQRQREAEAEERERKDREARFNRAPPVPAAVSPGTTAPAPARYVPPRRAASGAAAVTPPESDRRGLRQVDQRQPATDSWRTDRMDDRRPSAVSGRNDRTDDRRPSAASGSTDRTDDRRPSAASGSTGKWVPPYKR